MAHDEVHHVSILFHEIRDDGIDIGNIISKGSHSPFSGRLMITSATNFQQSKFKQVNNNLPEVKAKRVYR